MSDLSTNDLERQLRVWADDLALQVHDLRQQSTPVQELRPVAPHPRRVLVLVAVAALVLAGGLLLRAAEWRNEDATVASTSNGVVEVAYERVEYSQEANLACPTGTPAVRGFNRSTFESWADNIGRRWRNTVTYPDGTTRDLIALGSPTDLEATYDRGELRGADVGCPGVDGLDILISEPGQSGYFALNPGGDIMRSPDMAFTPTYKDLGEEVPGAHTDSTGRPADLWRETINGYLEVGTAHDQVPIVQTTDWYVDHETGEVIERSFSSEIAGIGTARSLLTRVDAGKRMVPQETFDSDGLNLVH